MAMQVNLTNARATLEELVSAALRGEKVVIARRGKPQVWLKPIALQTPPESGRS
jgi:prevent-host-death family protein